MLRTLQLFKATPQDVQALARRTQLRTLWLADLDNLDATLVEECQRQNPNLRIVVQENDSASGRLDATLSATWPAGCGNWA